MTDETAGPAPGPDDKGLLAELGGLLGRAAPVPGWLLEAGRASYGLRRIGAELAELTRDSLIDQPAVAVRGAGEPRTLTFDAPGLTVELELTGAEEPTVRAVEADDRGLFTVAGIGTGPLRLRCARPGQRAVATDWFLVA